MQSQRKTEDTQKAGEEYTSLGIYELQRPPGPITDEGKQGKNM